MKVKELRERLNAVPESQDDEEVVVIVKRPGSMGPTPSVRVRGASSGFDWNSGKFMLWTEKDVKEVGNEG